MPTDTVPQTVLILTQQKGDMEAGTARPRLGKGEDAYRYRAPNGSDPHSTKGRHGSGHCPPTTRQGRKCLQVPCYKRF
ncbi:hypothetical protein I4300191C4_00930 [Solibaculum mannosilyticum]